MTWDLRPSRSGHSRPRVLCVDDEPTILQLLRRLLDRHVVSEQRDRHSAHFRLISVTDRQGFDVEVAGPHQARHAIQDAGLVEDDRHQDVAVGFAVAGQGPGGRRGMGRGVMRRGRGGRVLATGGREPKHPLGDRQFPAAAEDPAQDLF